MNINALNEDNLFFIKKVLEQVPNLKPHSVGFTVSGSRRNAVFPLKPTFPPWSHLLVPAPPPMQNYRCTWAIVGAREERNPALTPNCTHGPQTEVGLWRTLVGIAGPRHLQVGLGGAGCGWDTGSASCFSLLPCSVE